MPNLHLEGRRKNVGVDRGYRANLCTAPGARWGWYSDPAREREKEKKKVTLTAALLVAKLLLRYVSSSSVREMPKKYFTRMEGALFQWVEQDHIVSENAATHLC